MDNKLNYDFAYLVRLRENTKIKNKLGDKIDRLKLDIRFKIFALFINPAFTALIHILIPEIPVRLLLLYMIIFIFIILRIRIDMYENGIVINKMFKTYRFHFSELKEIRPVFVEGIKGQGCKMVYQIKTGELSHINYILVDKNNREFLIDFEGYEKDALLRFLMALNLSDNEYVEDYRKIHSPFDL